MDEGVGDSMDGVLSMLQQQKLENRYIALVCVILVATLVGTPLSFAQWQRVMPTNPSAAQDPSSSSAKTVETEMDEKLKVSTPNLTDILHEQLSGGEIYIQDVKVERERELASEKELDGK